MFKYLSGRAEFVSQCDGQSPLADSPAPLELTDVQRALLHSMLAMERSPTVVIQDGDQLEVRSTVGAVIERLPVGKTTVCEALIRTDRLPSQHGERWELPYGLLVQTDLVPVPATIYVSDAEGIARMEERLSDLLVYVIGSVRDASMFPLPRPENPRRDRHGMPFPDVVLVKHGAAKIVDGRRESTLGALKKHLEGHVVARVIVDNFDGLRLSGADPVLPAAFTWLVSRRQRQCVPAVKMNTHPHASAFLRADYYDNPLVQLCRDEAVREYFTITVSRRFIERTLLSTMLSEQFFIVRGPVRALRAPRELLLLLLRPVACELDRILCARRLLDAGGSLREVRHACPLVGGRGRDSLDTVGNRIAHELQKLLVPMSRLIDGVRDGECRCCMAPFIDESVVTVYHCCQAVVCADCAAYKLSKCPVCMRLVSGDFCSEARLPELAAIDSADFLQAFPGASYECVDPLVCAVRGVLLGSDVVADLSRLGGTASLGSPGSYVRDLLGGRADRAPLTPRCVVFAPRKLRELLERDLNRTDAPKIELPDSARRVKDPHTVTHALLVSLASADRRRAVDELYNAAGREVNLKITRLELRVG
jgi:hypothetical protein